MASLDWVAGRCQTPANASGRDGGSNGRKSGVHIAVHNHGIVVLNSILIGFRRRARASLILTHFVATRVESMIGRGWQD